MGVDDNDNFHFLKYWPVINVTSYKSKLFLKYFVQVFLIRKINVDNYSPTVMFQLSYFLIS